MKFAKSARHVSEVLLPLRMSLSSNTSSCIKLAVWIISMISAKRLCSTVSSLKYKKGIIWKYQFDEFHIIKGT